MRDSLVPRLALAVAHGHAIFLDCSDDRYFALSPAENDALLRLLDGDRISARAQRALTAATGIEASAEHFRSLLAAASIGASVEFSTADTPSGWVVRLSAARHVVGTKVRLNMSGLYASLERVARVRHLNEARTGPDAVQSRDRVIGAHNWLSRHVTANDACLVRSLALALHLRSAGCIAQLVIGVRTDPFAAHCWVQLDNMVVNEDLDAVASFEPILVVR